MGGFFGGRFDCRLLGLAVVGCFVGCFGVVVVGWVVVGVVAVVLLCCGKEVGNGKRSQV